MEREESTTGIPKIMQLLNDRIESEIGEEGLFRMAGSKNATIAAKAVIDQGNYDMSNILDIHTICDIYKALLREMPEPMLTERGTPLFSNAHGR